MKKRSAYECDECQNGGPCVLEVDHDTVKPVDCPYKEILGDNTPKPEWYPTEINQGEE